jgi:hypothetical protein
MSFKFLLDQVLIESLNGIACINKSKQQLRKKIIHYENDSS